MSNRIPATSDIVFKYILGTEESVEILRSFISAVQRDSGFPAISEIQITNPMNVRNYSDAKLSIIDVRALDTAGNRYNVEVQVRSQPAFEERTLYYWAKSYADQLSDGTAYGDLHRVVGVSIVDFNLFSADIPYHSCFLLTEKDHCEHVLTEDCVLHYLELPKLPDNPKDELAAWLYFLQHAGEEDPLMKVLLDSSKPIRDASERYRRFTSDDRAREAYLEREKFLRDQQAFLENARREGREEGREEGRQEGREEGREEGVEMGREEGRDETKRELVRRMLDGGIPPAKIAELTDLDVKEIERLREGKA